MFSWILIGLSAFTSYHFMDVGSGDYILSKTCPIIFSSSIILAFLKLSNPKDGGSSGGWTGGSSSGSGGGDCGAGDGGC